MAKQYSEPELGGFPKGFKPSDIGLKNSPTITKPAAPKMRPGVSPMKINPPGAMRNSASTPKMARPKARNATRKAMGRSMKGKKTKSR